MKCDNNDPKRYGHIFTFIVAVTGNQRELDNFIYEMSHDNYDVQFDQNGISMIIKESSKKNILKNRNESHEEVRERVENRIKCAVEISKVKVISFDY